jgi:hypothetical protein
LYVLTTSAYHISNANQRARVPRQNDKKAQTSPSPESSAAASRRASQRQQEKAPEGRVPRAVVDEATGTAADTELEADGAGSIGHAIVGESTIPGGIATARDLALPYSIA